MEKKEKEFLRVSALLRKHGIDFVPCSAYSHAYFDGSEHCSAFPCLRVSIDHDLTENAFQKKYFLRSIEKRFRSLVFMTRDTLNYTVIEIMRGSDHKRMTELNREADAFLSAFWEYRHNNPQASQLEMIQAGKEALHNYFEL